VERRERRVLLVSSSGGVLLDVLALAPWWRQQGRAWAVVRASDAESALVGERVHWIREWSLARPTAIGPALVAAWRILRRERPALVVSAGSGAAIPFFMIARARGIPTIWLSTLNLVAPAGISGRICSRLASRVLLQRASMLAAYPEGTMIGELY
jgi:UDP-N-acetylglucosamine:LPS N-acetylglucosamine transferase